MSDQIFKPIIEDEISLKDIVDFLAESWKLIILTGLLGLLGSIAYLWVTPNQYQAIAQIQMAQISSNNITNPLGTNIEDPSLLLSRLKLPSAYSFQVINACGFESSNGVYETLAGNIKFSAVKGVESIIELKINRDSKETAVSCAKSLFEDIKASQNEIIKPHIEAAKILLGKYQDRLINSQSIISRADKSGVALTAAYLSGRDEVRFLTEEILRLNAFITTADSRQAKLVAPIYVFDAPVYPKTKFSLLVGLLMGLLLGLLFNLAKKFLASRKSS